MYDLQRLVLYFFYILNSGKHCTYLYQVLAHCVQCMTEVRLFIFLATLSDK